MMRNINSLERNRRQNRLPLLLIAREAPALRLPRLATSPGTLLDLTTHLALYFRRRVGIAIGPFDRPFRFVGAGFFFGFRVVVSRGI